MNFYEFVAEYLTELSAAFFAVFIPAAVFLVIRRDRRKLSIRSPKLGILNLQGKLAASWITEDRAAIESFFSSVEESAESVMKCDVLFVYCDFNLDGKIVGKAQSLSDVIRKSRAHIVVLASEPSGRGSQVAMAVCRNVRANVVMTMERKGAAFPSFYKRLFSAMAGGIGMSTAWTSMAPQISGSEHEGLPSGFMTCGAGDLWFR